MLVYCCNMFQYASVLMGISNTVATIPGIVSPSITGSIVTHRVGQSSSNYHVTIIPCHLCHHMYVWAFLCTSHSLCVHLHWLPVNYRIKFKLSTLTYRTLAIHQPPYLARLLHFSNIPRQLRSSTSQQLYIPRTKLHLGKVLPLSVKAKRIFKKLLFCLKSSMASLWCWLARPRLLWMFNDSVFGCFSAQDPRIQVLQKFYYYMISSYI